MRVRRPGVIPAGVAVAVVLAGAAATMAMTDAGAAPAAPTGVVPPATAEITRGDLTDTTSVGGTLTYVGERRVYAGGRGTVTAVPKEGATVTRGRALMKVDRRPAVLMYGELPMYRTLALGVSNGPDVEQLERNLRALGYGDDMTVDTDFTWATTRAVLDWQDDRGLPETGSVDAGQVVFLPGPVRVVDVKMEVGDAVAPGRQVLAVTSTRRIVHVDLDAADQSLVKKGTPVSVELPGGREVEGRISSVGTVAKASGEEGEPESDGEATVDVEITLRSAGKAKLLDQAPVTVTVESERVKDVLSVPVEALLALREGGFGVEVVEGATSRVVAVETGVYGGGRVEISGTGLAEGMKVGVPER
ncbi:peptidoglycan-binding protein [Sphaerisporangium sp. TRM90804]|uniref:peptidoglycan-binding protein n=1 Tax=Sphaerisporangium sp. TRM90804 TaxID=3031113 RepID=UPI0024491561|nr:peptidoglycan-binding protein [Sphaerisporangium sp. TRM90804]MDH2427479.1 peptidoglycan-binding protein [Sphaerisporangium sp. TRM90804]